jgi:hypothetical protein
MTGASEPAGLMPFILAVITPFLLAGGIPDPALAQQVAAQTIAAYQTTGNDQLLTAGRIVAFAMAALENLRLSAPPDLSVSLKLKLRGNATGLNRAAETATTTLNTQRQATPDQTQPDLDPAEIMESLATARSLLKPTPEPKQEQHKTDRRWAGAMTDIAAELTGELPSLPTAQRQAHLARIAALSKIATMLGKGEAPPLKARLLGSTALDAIARLGAEKPGLSP